MTKFHLKKTHLIFQKGFFWMSQIFCLFAFKSLKVLNMQLPFSVLSPFKMKFREFKVHLGEKNLFTWLINHKVSTSKWK